MSYNWTSASTPQGRERLKDLMESNIAVISMSGDGELSECFIEPDGTIVINHSSYEDWQDVDDMDVLFGLEFLDPSPSPSTSPEPVADENGLLPCPSLIWEQSPTSKNRQNAHFMGCWYSIVLQKNGKWLVFLRDESGKGNVCLSESLAKSICEDHFRKLWESENRRAGKETNP